MALSEIEKGAIRSQILNTAGKNRIMVFGYNPATKKYIPMQVDDEGKTVVTVD